jgi:hypothetical protein
MRSALVTESAMTFIPTRAYCVLFRSSASGLDVHPAALFKILDRYFACFKPCINFLGRPISDRTDEVTPWPESVNKLYQPGDHRLSAKLVPTFADRGCHVVSMTDPYSRILSRSELLLFSQLAPKC